MRMKILLIGATGKIGSALAPLLRPHHELLEASRNSPLAIDITDEASVRALFAKTGKLDAVINAAGGAVWKAFAELTPADFEKSFSYKLMGQINLARLSVEHLNDNGSITLTGGWWAREPVVNSTAIATVNAALEGFVRAAALEMPRGIRINLVAPPLVGPLQLVGDRITHHPANEVAQAYLQSVHGPLTGQVIDTRVYARR